MTNRRNFLIASAVVLSVLSPVVSTGADSATFSQQAFDKAQKAGKPILVDITAPWCPTCRAQKKVLNVLLPEHNDMAVFHVDFNSQKDVVRAFGANMQSTLITYKGKTEVGRLVGVSDEGSIRKLLKMTM